MKLKGIVVAAALAAVTFFWTGAAGAAPAGYAVSADYVATAGWTTAGAPVDRAVSAGHATPIDHTAAEGRITRVEPLSWWTGMKTPLQLMFYGSDLRGAEVRVMQPGLSVAAVHNAASPNYLFVDVVVDPAARAGDYTFEFSKGGRVWSYPYTIHKRAANSAERKGFGPRDAIYLLMPDRFANGDRSNDSVEGLPDKLNLADKDGRHGGDIQGIIDRLDYISELGMTAIWSTPLLLDNEPRVSYHGYACADYYQIDPRYGSNELYREMVAESHERGIKVIMDMVPNHCGTAHPWIADLPFPDWINTFDTFTRTNHTMNSPMDPHAAESERVLFETGWFDTSMPDMNMHNPFVFNYFRQWAVWWIEWAGLDGLRVDTYPYNPRGPMDRWTADVLDEYPHLNIVAECWYPTPALIARWEGRNTVMDFPMMIAITDALSKDQIAWGEGLKRVYDVVSQDFVYKDPSKLMIMASNHDTDHLVNTLGGNPAKVRLAYTLLATMRGVPQFWAGDEMLLAGDPTGGDGAKRVDMIEPSDLSEMSLSSGADGFSCEACETLTHLHKLLGWRKSNDVIAHGKLLHYMPRHPDNVYVYFRYTDNDRVMVIVNGSPEERTIDWSLYTEGTAGRTRGVDILSERTITVGSPLTVPPHGSMVIELR